MINIKNKLMPYIEMAQDLWMSKNPQSVAEVKAHLAKHATYHTGAHTTKTEMTAEDKQYHEKGRPKEIHDSIEYLASQSENRDEFDQILRKKNLASRNTSLCDQAIALFNSYTWVQAQESCKKTYVTYQLCKLVGLHSKLEGTRKNAQPANQIVSELQHLKLQSSPPTDIQVVEVLLKYADTNAKTGRFQSMITYALNKAKLSTVLEEAGKRITPEVTKQLLHEQREEHQQRKSPH